jgi:hypothetical protein
MKENGAKKPPNQFFLYKKDIVGSLIRKHGKKPNRILAKMVAKLWAKETTETKAYYTKMARLKVKEHMEQFPNFVWPSKSQGYQVHRSQNSRPDSPCSKSMSPDVEREGALKFESKDNTVIEMHSCLESKSIDSSRVLERFDGSVCQTGWTPPPESIFDILYNIQSSLFE